MTRWSHLAADGRVLRTIDTREAVDEDAAPDARGRRGDRATCT